MKIYLSCIIVLLFISIISCEKDENSNNSFYYNSFEQKNDTIDWGGYGYLERFNEGAPGAGNWSLSVLGGCPTPHAKYIFGPYSEPHEFSLRCYSKTEIGCNATISLAVESDFIMLTMYDTAWTLFEHQESISLPAGKEMELRINANSLVGSSLLIDMIEVIEK